MPAGEQTYLLPHVVAKLANMELRARLVVEGFIAGLHRSPYHGFSVEFAEHRPYMPGDEIRRIDWKVYGRTDRYYIKQYEEETNLKSYIVLDTSRSMTYASAGQISKLEYASYLAASLAYMMVKQSDAVGLALVRRDSHVFPAPPGLTGLSAADPCCASECAFDREDRSRAIVAPRRGTDQAPRTRDHSERPDG